MARYGSAAFLVVAGVVSFLLAMLLFTALDPVWGGFIDSSAWSASTSIGAKTLGYQETFYNWVWFVGLIGLLFSVFVKSRRPA